MRIVLAHHNVSSNRRGLHAGFRCCSEAGHWRSSLHRNELHCLWVKTRLSILVARNVCTSPRLLHRRRILHPVRRRLRGPGVLPSKSNHLVRPLLFGYPASNVSFPCQRKATIGRRERLTPGIGRKCSKDSGTVGTFAANGRLCRTPSARPIQLHCSPPGTWPTSRSNWGVQ